MVFLNKALLSSEKIHLNAPLFITWFQCITCVGICRLLKGLNYIFPKYFYFPEGSPFSYNISKTVQIKYICIDVFENYLKTTCKFMLIVDDVTCFRFYHYQFYLQE
jgi:hypothetical protein